MPNGVPILPSLSSWVDNYDVRNLIGQFYVDYVVNVWEEWSTFLKIPSWDVWWNEHWMVALHHMYHATIAFWKAAVLTIEPLWILTSYFGQIFLKWLARHSVDKVTKTARYLFRKQCELSRVGLYIEAGVICSVIGLYLLRRYIRRKRYIPRTVAWYGRQKRKCSQTVHRYQMKISKTSVVLAHLFPHFLFLSVMIFFLIFTPLLQTLSQYPQFLSFLSLYHPLFQTIRSLHFTSTSDVASTKHNLRNCLQYWVIYAVVVATKQFYNHLPFLATTVSYMNHFLPITTISFLPTLQLISLLWLRFLPATNATKGKVKKHFYEHSSPLNMVYYAIEPAIRSILPTSQMITSSSWMTWLLSKIKSGLEVAVWVRMILPETKQTIMKVITECAAILPVSITLFMPSHFTVYGIIYVSYLVPAAYSANAIVSRSNTKRRNQFWILHYLVLVVLNLLEPFLRWIFFSTHLTLILWASVQYESMIQYVYETILQTELEAFGLLPRNPYSKTKPIPIEKTRTYRLLHSIIQKLPSGATDEKEKEKERSSVSTENNSKNFTSNEANNIIKDEEGKENDNIEANNISKDEVKENDNTNSTKSITPAKRINENVRQNAETKNHKIAKLVQKYESQESNDK